MTDCNVVRYFYLPKRENHPAELILVYRSEKEQISLPVLEEVFYLDAIYERKMTERERSLIPAEKRYKVYYSFEILHRYHQKHGVPDKVKQDLEALSVLSHFPQQQISLDEIYGLV
jgi:hypothetical protein